MPGSVVAGIGLATGTVASTGAIILFGLDGAVFRAEIFGQDAIAKKIEDNSTVGWLRIGATIMLLPDLPVGGVRALKEIGMTAGEASAAMARMGEADVQTGKAARDLRNVTNPSRHPTEVARQMDRVRKYQAEAEVQSKLVEQANGKIRRLFARDVLLFPSATAGGAALMTAAPPGVVLSPAQKAQDEDFIKSISPAEGMKDARLDIRVMGYSDQGKS